MNLTYFVGGVNGVGKTTLLKKIAETQPGFVVVKGSEELMKWLGIPGDYEALRALPDEQKREEWARCLERLFEANQGRSLLVDGHYLNLIDGVVTSVMGEWACRFDAFVLVTAPTVDILRRIDKDSDRDRALFKLDEPDRYGRTEQYQQQTRAEFDKEVAECAVPGLIIHHLQRQTPKAVKEFLDFHTALQTQPA